MARPKDVLIRVGLVAAAAGAVAYYGSRTPDNTPVAPPSTPVAVPAGPTPENTPPFWAFRRVDVFYPTPDRTVLRPGEFDERAETTDAEVLSLRNFLNEHIDPEIIKKYGYVFRKNNGVVNAVVQKASAPLSPDRFFAGGMGYFAAYGGSEENPHVSSFDTMIERYDRGQQTGGWRGAMPLSVTMQKEAGPRPSATQVEMLMLHTLSGPMYTASLSEGKILPERLGDGRVFRELRPFLKRADMSYAPHAVSGWAEGRSRTFENVLQIRGDKLGEAAEVIFLHAKGAEWTAISVDFRYLPHLQRNPVERAAVHIPAVEAVVRDANGRSIEYYLDSAGLARVRETQASLELRERLQRATPEKAQDILKQKADAVKVGKKYIFPYFGPINWEELSPFAWPESDENAIDGWELRDTTTGGNSHSLRVNISNIYGENGKIVESRITGRFDPKKLPGQGGIPVPILLPENMQFFEPTIILYEQFEVDGFKGIGTNTEGKQVEYKQDIVGNFSLTIK